MPRIFDNIDSRLLPALLDALGSAARADFCVGYFNLRGWRLLAAPVDAWPGGEGAQARLLVGMHRPADRELLRQWLGETPAAAGGAGAGRVDRQTQVRLKRKLAREFRDQLQVGVPTDADEAGLRRLARQLRAGKVVVRLFLAHPLHAKLYLAHRDGDATSPAVGFVGSSNLTLAGLRHQGELNVDVLDHDACAKLAAWFEGRWTDTACLDISAELAAVIEGSWAGEQPVPPFHIYAKMAYHLSREAQRGLREFAIPAVFGDTLFRFQEEAVKIAAQYLRRQGGVLIGDVVGLGKTLMATAVAKIFEDDEGLETLILCPPKLAGMWQWHANRYGLRATVQSTGGVTGTDFERSTLRHRIVIVDESHNLRDRRGKRWQAVKHYLERNESRVILLSATPYNKDLSDLSDQLRLFVEPDADLGLRPERDIAKAGGSAEFQARNQCPERSLLAFEKSDEPDDWRELMRLFLVRRTRSFIEETYGEHDAATGRRYLPTADGGRAYFTRRVPRTVPFAVDESDPSDPYARLFRPAVVDAINALHLPRYGLGLYLGDGPADPPDAAEAAKLADLAKAVKGKRLMGFCRTNLLKRLESCGPAFLLSVQRHVLRNALYLHALDNGLPLPLGNQHLAMLEPEQSDADLFGGGGDEDEEDESPRDSAAAADAYRRYQQHADRFDWLRPGLFDRDRLAADLRADNDRLLKVLADAGRWEPADDAKLNALHDLLTIAHAGEKVLVFSQFGDTVAYLGRQLAARGVTHLAAARSGGVEVAGGSIGVEGAVHRFSPHSNGQADVVRPEDELRVLVTTDMLSEGQNLQDAATVVNFDLPWAVIRLTQRAGRVDRIGQASPTVLCYSFMPADGVERLIDLRGRLDRRLRQERDVIASDERPFEDSPEAQAVRDLFNETLDLAEDDGDRRGVDLASHALGLWNEACAADPTVRDAVESLPNVVHATRGPHGGAEGVVTYLRTADGVDHLVWLDRDGGVVTESMFDVLDAARCDPGTPARPHHAEHHGLVAKAVERVAERASAAGGQLGSPRSARYRVYHRLKRFADVSAGTLVSALIDPLVQAVYDRPLRPLAVDTLNRQLRLVADDEAFALFVADLHREGRLVRADEGEEGDADADAEGPAILCSMGLFSPG